MSRFVCRSWIVVLSLVAGLLGSSGTSVAQSAPTQTTANRAALLVGVPDIQLETPAAGGGSRPTLTWSSVPDAASYVVTLYLPAGPAYWAWQGPDPSVELGGGSGPLPPTAPGPMISAGMTWQVLAYDVNGNLVAASDRIAMDT